MSLRWRLNVALIFLTTLSVVVYGGYDMLGNSRLFYQEVDRLLAMRASVVATQLQMGELEAALATVPGEEDRIEILNAQGQHWQGARLDRAGMRVFTLPVLDAQRKLQATVVVARPLQKVEQEIWETNQRIILAQCLGGLVILLAVSLVVAQGMVPLQKMAETASEIVDSQDFSRRVPELASDDELGQMSRALNALIARVEGLLEEQRIWLADTSHELRNPLAVLRTNVEFLGHELDPQTRMQVVAESEGEILRLTRLIDDLRSLTTSDGARFEKSEVELGSLAQEVVNRLTPLAGERVLELDLRSPATVEGDSHRLSQVLENLLSNAIRYTDPPSRIRVVVEGSTITVEDEGIGIPAESLPHVFDRFFRVDKARARDTGGTGLGLAIARSIVERHQGTLTAESTLGKGSCFQLRLPPQSRTSS